MQLRCWRMCMFSADRSSLIYHTSFNLANFISSISLGSVYYVAFVSFPPDVKLKRIINPHPSLFLSILTTDCYVTQYCCQTDYVVFVDPTKRVCVGSPLR